MEDWILEGIHGRCFPQVDLEGIDGDLKEVSENFNSDTKTKLSPFEGAGVMIGREFVTTRVPAIRMGFVTTSSAKFRMSSYPLHVGKSEIHELTTAIHTIY